MNQFNLTKTRTRASIHDLICSGAYERHVRRIRRANERRRGARWRKFNCAGLMIGYAGLDAAAIDDSIRRLALAIGEF